MWHLFIIQSKHLELFCKITIQLSPSCIFLGLWSKVRLATLQKNYFSWISASWMAAVLHLASSKSRTHCTIALTFSEVQLKWTLIKTVYFFLIICRSLGIYHMWLNNNSWPDIFAHLSKIAKKQEKMRHHFEASCNTNILNWKLYQKINSIRT